jgi:hypothetical protein
MEASFGNTKVLRNYGCGTDNPLIHHHELLYVLFGREFGYIGQMGMRINPL